MQLFDSLMMVSCDKGDTAGTLVYFGPAYPDSLPVGGVLEVLIGSPT